MGMDPRLVVPSLENIPICHPHGPKTRSGQRAPPDPAGEAFLHSNSQSIHPAEAMPRNPVLLEKHNTSRRRLSNILVEFTHVQQPFIRHFSVDIS